jgi:hypothetical protein
MTERELQKGLEIQNKIRELQKAYITDGDIDEEDDNPEVEVLVKYFDVGEYNKKIQRDIDELKRQFSVLGK